MSLSSRLAGVKMQACPACRGTVEMRSSDFACTKCGLVLDSMNSSDNQLDF